MSLNWTVKELLQYKDEGFSIDEEVQLPDVLTRDPEVRKLTPVHVKGFVEFNPAYLTFHLTVSGEMTLPCAISLQDVLYPFSIQTAETYPLKDEKEIEIEETPVEVIHSVKSDDIDLNAALVEAILVEKPMRVISEKAMEAAKLEGQGWSLMTEKDKKEQVDPRLEKLKRFFDE